MEKIYEQHVQEMTQARAVRAPYELEKAQSAIGVGVRLSQAEAILQTIDDALKRLHMAAEALDEKLAPLDGSRPEPAPQVAMAQAEQSYEHASTLMCALEDRARTIDRVVARLQRLHARTEL